MEHFNYTSLRNKIFKPTNNSHQTISVKNGTHEIVFITSYPPRECGIATYSQDLVSALNNKFNTSFKLKICPIESNSEQFEYDFKVPFVLNSEDKNSYLETSKKINQNPNIKIVLLQHEFGFFEKNKSDLIELLVTINKPIIIVFHTILKKPNHELKTHVQFLAKIADALIVMTNFSKEILVQDYEIETTKINVIAHGTHLIPNSDKSLLKEKYQLSGKQVLSTFGLLSSGKSIETTLYALPKIVKENSNVLFLILGKTHPGIVKNEGEKYRESLEKIIKDLKMEKHVRFVNDFLPLSELLEYLQLTDIYLFTSKDPNQAVSGTFSYAISCGCPIISTPIPHAVEDITEHIGRIIPFEDSDALALEVNLFLRDKVLIKQINLNCLHKMASTAWENSAIAHAQVFQKVSLTPFQLEYNLPKINLNHIHKMTTDFAMIQFSIINQADINSGYTLDDNARAMVALCQHYELTKDRSDLKYVVQYLDFICFCMQEEGYFLNYVDERKVFTKQNYETNLADSNGRAIWALGYLISLKAILPEEIVSQADAIFEISLTNLPKIYSTRAMAFALKGLYYRNLTCPSDVNINLIETLADRLVQMFKHEKDSSWSWFESYLTYANSILPEALLCAYLASGKSIYKEIAKESFDFLLGKTFNEDEIKIVSNKGWMHKGKSSENLDTHFNRVGGEQPIDIAYTILALSKFYKEFKQENYNTKMNQAFSWFLGNNHLNQIIYNPCTGGCYDGLEESYINLNQGAESTVSYLMARLCVEKSNFDSIPDDFLDQFKLNLDLKLITS